MTPLQLPPVRPKQGFNTEDVRGPRSATEAVFGCTQPILVTPWPPWPSHVVRVKESTAPMATDTPSPPPEWRIADGLTPYADAVAHMQERVAAIRAGTAAEQVWLVEH